MANQGPTGVQTQQTPGFTLLGAYMPLFVNYTNFKLRL